MPDGNRYTNAPNADDRAAWKVVTKHAPDKTEGQAREIIKAWVKNTVLIIEEYENPVTRKVVNSARYRRDAAIARPSPHHTGPGIVLGKQTYVPESDAEHAKWQPHSEK